MVWLQVLFYIYAADVLMEFFYLTFTEPDAVVDFL